VQSSSRAKAGMKPQCSSCTCHVMPTQQHASKSASSFVKPRCASTLLLDTLALQGSPKASQRQTIHS